MARNRAQHRQHLTEVLFDALGDRLKAPVGILLGSPLAVTDLVENLDELPSICYQMDLYQADRLEDLLRERGIDSSIAVAPDLWDLPDPVPTLLYPVPQGGERQLKIDMIEQAYHALKPRGILVVLSPFEKDQFFPQVLKKMFGKVHAPMSGGNALLWCQRGAEKPRRRHEISYQVRHRGRSVRFVSRPGVFSYGRFDNGARALMDAVTVAPGQRILDMGCGVGTNGVLAALDRGPDGFTAFLDSNTRATALAELNAQTNEIGSFEAKTSAHGEGFEEGSFDLVLANPPYFAQLGIAQRFIEQSRKYLRPGGVLYLVTKQVNQVAEMMDAQFAEVEGEERRGYVVFRGVA